VPAGLTVLGLTEAAAVVLHVHHWRLYVEWLLPVLLFLLCQPTSVKYLFGA